MCFTYRDYGEYFAEFCFRCRIWACSFWAFLPFGHSLSFVCSFFFRYWYLNQSFENIKRYAEQKCYKFVKIRRKDGFHLKLNLNGQNSDVILSQRAPVKSMDLDQKLLWIHRPMKEDSLFYSLPDRLEGLIMISSYSKEYERYSELSSKYDNAMMKVADNLQRYKRLYKGSVNLLDRVGYHSPSFDAPALNKSSSNIDKVLRAIIQIQEEQEFIKEMDHYLSQLPDFRKQVIQDWLDHCKLSKHSDMILQESFLAIAFQDEKVDFSREDWRELISTQPHAFGSDYLSDIKDYVIHLLEQSGGILTGVFRLQETDETMQETWNLLSKKERTTLEDNINRRLRGDLLATDIETKRILRRACIRFAYFYPPLENEKDMIWSEIIQKPHDFSKKFLTSLKEQDMAFQAKKYSLEEALLSSPYVSETPALEMA